MKKPHRLPQGGTIYLVSPSFGCSQGCYKTRFEAAIKNLQALGYNVIIGENCFNQVGLLSAPKEICAKEINTAFESNADLILSIGGGEIMVEIMPYIDFSKIKKPIWFVGFSDNANLTYTLPTICDIEAIYAPNAPDFCVYPFQCDVKETMEILTLDKRVFQGYPKWELIDEKSEATPLCGYNLSEEKILKFYNTKNKTSIQGRLIGGCLDVLVNLLGTNLDHTKEFIEKYKNDGLIWFMEACALDVCSIRRAFHQLKLAGWFKYVKGFLIGRPQAAWQKEFFGLNQYTAVTDIVGEYGVPIVMDVDLGHFSPMIPMRTGALAEVEILPNDIKITYLE